MARVLFRNKIRKSIKGYSYLDLPTLLKPYLPLLEARLNQPLAPGIFSTGQIRQLKMIGLLADAKTIQAQFFIKADVVLTASRL